MADYDELMELGFTEISAPIVKKIDAPPKNTVKKVVKEKQVVVAAPQNDKLIEVASKAIADSNTEMRTALNELVTKIEPRPKKMRVNINRNSAGFMDSFDIDLEY